MKVSYPFKIGALVTGTDRSYYRSIYKLINYSHEQGIGLFEWQSLKNDTVKRWKDMRLDKSRYELFRSYSEFRLAEPDEILKSNKTTAKYGLYKLLKGLGLSVEGFLKLY